MSRLHALALALLCALLILAPVLAEARAGGSARAGGGMSYSSHGSLGSRTYGNNGGQPVERSMTPPGSGGYASRPGFAQSHPFLTGLAGAFFGSWLGSMLFPHWGMGFGFGHVLGSLFSWLIVLWLVAMALRMFRRSGPLTSPSSADFSYSGAHPASAYGGAFGGVLGGRSEPLAITQADYGAFEAILKTVQGAWSKGDLATLRQYVTPEMLAYFSEQLAGNASQGVANHVDAVEFVSGDLREAWDEGHLQYATCLLHWRALDYTVRTDRKPEDPGWLVEGDPAHPVGAQELWTFARSPGGHWLLSAIQQV